jgi:hypothetical protein
MLASFGEVYSGFFAVPNTQLLRTRTSVFRPGRLEDYAEVDRECRAPV